MFEPLSSQYVQGLALYYHTVGGDESVALSQQSIIRPLGTSARSLKPPATQSYESLLLQVMPLDGEKVMGTFLTG